MIAISDNYILLTVCMCDNRLRCITYYHENILFDCNISIFVKVSFPFHKFMTHSTITLLTRDINNEIFRESVENS